MHDCRNLLSLTFARSGNPYFPNPVVNAPRLVKLDLEVNYIKIIPSQISMLKTLTTLNLACNRISSLPESFGSLQNLTNINLSSNRIKTIPSSITKIKGLKRLDLSYNSIVSLPDSISELDKLEVLQLSANFLSKELPDFVSKMQALIKIDIRFNKITKLDSLKELPKLEVIRAAGNSVSTFISKASNLFEVELNMNPLTFVNFECPMPNLKIVDFSKGKLTSCDFVSSLTNVEKLTLDNNHLVSLSNNISKMKNLVHLSVIKNNITALPDCIGSLTKLKTLDLHLNNISVLNPDIWKLSNLEILNVSSNLLQNFPEPPEALLKNFLSRKSKLQHQKQIQDQIIENAKLQNKQTAIDTDEEDEAAEYEELNAHIGDNEESPKNLKDLAINVSDSKQKKSSISPPLSPSTALTQTSMSINDSLTGTVSEEKQKSVFSNIRRRGSEIDPHQQLYIGLEKSLKYLSMADNKLNDGVIQIISRFQNLEILNISYNDLFDIPSGHLSNLKKLKSLYLSGNHLSSLPVEDFDAFTEVTSLNLNGNRYQTLPAEIYKIKNLTALDVGSNSLKYNIANIPYDWNWCYNPNLKYLNFSGNKRLEIKPQHKREGMTDSLDSFLTLKNLKLLGLMDVTITTDAVPEQTVDTRVRTTASQLGSFGYGISDTLGDRLNLTTRDVVIEKFRGNPDETLLTIYDGKNCSDVAGDKISKIIQETFGIHLTKELQDVEEPSEGYSGKTVVDALRGAFLTMNSEMNILINKGQSSTFSYTAAHRTTTTDELSLEEDGHTGCCSTVIYIKGDDLYIANIGDVMGLLTKSDGEYKILTTKHEPYAPEEYERIRASGGYVTTDGYLDGVSEVSRAAGFFKLIPHINAAPSISHVKLSQNEEMIAIATSEIWKKVPHDLIADIVRQEKSNPGIAAEKLRDFAISYGVNEKITAVVLSLRQFSSKQKTHDRSSQAEDSTLRKLDEEIDPPIGDVAMVFTDIKNSTLLWDNYPEAMRSAIKVHNAIMRRQLRIIGGYEVKTEGDAFMVSFPTVTSALLWCFTVQSQLLATPEWPTEILASDQGYEIKDDKGNLIFKGLSVRMGIHWGTPVCERDVVTKRMDYFGPMVNRASRVSAVADGGQITMSTDLYSEFKKILGYHEAYNEKKQSLEEIYGDNLAYLSKAFGFTFKDDC
ncbi:unnamed protein product [[Candida] boidinii]|nr:unnamed protein product [[Candida] boidinii]